MKLCPSWKVYQGWMGCDPFDSIAIPLCEVTVNKAYGDESWHGSSGRIAMKRSRPGRRWHTVSAFHDLFRLLGRVHQRLPARHRVAFELVLHCSYHPDDRRDYDGPARDDFERALFSRLARRFPLSAGNHVHHHLDLVDLLRTRKSQR
jgi:hypothetical protein